jgi:hypothetical protein
MRGRAGSRHSAAATTTAAPTSVAADGARQLQRQRERNGAPAGVTFPVDRLKLAGIVTALTR